MMIDRYDKYDTRMDLGSAKVSPKEPDEPPPPVWHRFAGFSYLFDNPGAGVVGENGCIRICTQAEKDERLGLYATIAETVGRMEVDDLTRHFQFYPLPPSTYHVTVWDGVNAGNASTLEESAKEEFERVFADPPGSVIESWPPMMADCDVSLPTGKGVPIKFAYKKLEGRGTTVLVVDLAPIDEEQRERLRTLESFRRDLDDFFEKRGKVRNFSYRPHIAVGYFANNDLGHQAQVKHFDEWSALFNEALDGQTIEFDSISLYAFSDMITYFKKK